MAKAAYIGVDGIARKIKKMYVGIDGVARKVKKAYIGVAGVARLFFSGDRKLSYYGTITPLSMGRSGVVGASVGDYALFGGGETVRASGSKNYVEGSSIVDVYNSSLTKSTATALSVSRYGDAATSIGDYALFGGGQRGKSDNGGSVNTVDAYNSSLTRSTPTGLSVTKSLLAATTIGDYALFGGGCYIDSFSESTAYNTVDAYNSSLTRSNPTGLSVARRKVAATSVGNYALFGGGYFQNECVVDAYDASLTRTTPTALSVVRGQISATSVGNYALFGGGWNPTSDVVDVYDASLTKSIATPLSVARYGSGAVSSGDYALFGGGYSTGLNNTVDAYDASLTRTTPTALSVARHSIGTTTVGKYILFGGGWTGTTQAGRLSVVDAYMVE